jgi:hypothetical protein
VNGVPSCANDWLLQDVARDEWGFDGYVTSDCDADNDVVFSHHYTDIPEQGVQDVLRAGTAALPPHSNERVSNGPQSRTRVWFVKERRVASVFGCYIQCDPVSKCLNAISGKKVFGCYIQCDPVRKCLDAIYSAIQ